MSLSTLILYGSCARNDQNNFSDVDMFGISSRVHYSMAISNNINLAICPREDAFLMSRRGDLFMLHIVAEGKAIYQSGTEFDDLKSSFIYRSNYDDEVASAADLGWSIICGADKIRNWKLINKRIAWCVRTVVIAKAATLKIPIFSSTALEEFARDRTVSQLISIKESNAKNKSVLKSFDEFLRRHTKTKPESINAAEFSIQENHFKSEGNIVGLKTIRAFINDTNEKNYW